VAAGETVIRNASDLNNVRNNSSGKFIMMADVDLSVYANWTPIASFSGTFEGNCYEISNLTIDATNNLGLFNSVNGAGAELNRVALTHVDIKGQSYIGSIAANLLDGAKIKYSHSTGIINSDYRYNDYTGGLVGVMHRGSSIENSYSMMQVSAVTSAGGLVGKMYSSSTIKNSYSTGDISSSYSDGSAGGIAGSAYSSSTISNSYSTGNISASGSAGGIAGLAGQAGVESWEDAGDFGINIYNSYSTGTISANYGAGGIAEGLLGNINACVGIGPSVTAEVSSGKAGRIICGFGGGGGVSNNFAREDMKVEVNGVAVVPESNANGFHGEGRPWTDFELSGTNIYADSLGWKFGNDDENPWKMPPEDSTYKCPILFWQTAAPDGVCPPPPAP
jgi:hypothetical protein